MGSKEVLQFQFHQQTQTVGGNQTNLTLMFLTDLAAPQWILVLTKYIYLVQSILSAQPDPWGNSS